MTNESESLQVPRFEKRRKRLKRRDQKVSGLTAVFDSTAVMVSASPPEYRRSLNWSIVIQVKHGKPNELSAMSRVNARTPQCLVGKGIRRKRKPGCNGADRDIPTSKDGRLPEGLQRKTMQGN
jgi:hypothetical protein